MNEVTMKQQKLFIFLDIDILESEIKALPECSDGYNCKDAYIKQLLNLTRKLKNLM